MPVTKPVPMRIIPKPMKVLRLSGSLNNTVPQRTPKMGARKVTVKALVGPACSISQK
jgi:hypothetical protein